MCYTATSVIGRYPLLVGSLLAILDVIEVIEVYLMVDLLIPVVWVKNRRTPAIKCLQHFANDWTCLSSVTPMIHKLSACWSYGLIHNIFMFGMVIEQHNSVFLITNNKCE